MIPIYVEKVVEVIVTLALVFHSFVILAAHRGWIGESLSPSIVRSQTTFLCLVIICLVLGGFYK